MKLLELVKKQFVGLEYKAGEEYVLDPKKLDNIKYELDKCEEFKGRTLLIAHSPIIELKSGDKTASFTVKEYMINDRMPLIIITEGTVYLYSISTKNFIDYKIRMEIIKEVYDLDGLDEEQKEHIQRIIDDVNKNWNSPDYIRNKIDAYRQENAGKKIFEEMAKNDNYDTDMKTFVKEAFKSLPKKENKYVDGYVEYINTPGAELMTREMYGFNKHLTDEWLKNGNGLRYNDWLINKYTKSINSFNGLELVNGLHEIAESYKRGENPDRDEYIEFDNGKAYLNKNGKRSFFANIEDNRKTYDDIINELDSIDSDLNSCDCLEEEQIVKLKEKLKSFENKLKEKEIKPKTITISGSVHNKIKNYCGYIGIKIGDWVEQVLLEAIKPAVITEKIDYNNYEKDLEKVKEELIQSWIKSKDRNKVIIADKLILLPKFKFLGYESCNGKPTYDFIGTDSEFKELKDKIKCNIVLVADKKRSLISGFEFNEDELGELDETAVYIGRYK